MQRKINGTVLTESQSAKLVLNSIKYEGREITVNEQIEFLRMLGFEPVDGMNVNPEDIENAVKNALQTSGKFIPWQVVTISTDGKILD